MPGDPIRAQTALTCSTARSMFRRRPKFVAMSRRIGSMNSRWKRASSFASWPRANSLDRMPSRLQSRGMKRLWLMMLRRLTHTTPRCASERSICSAPAITGRLSSATFSAAQLKSSRHSHKATSTSGSYVPVKVNSGRRSTPKVGRTITRTFTISSHELLRSPRIARTTCSFSLRSMAGLAQRVPSACTKKSLCSLARQSGRR